MESRGNASSLRFCNYLVNQVNFKINEELNNLTMENNVTIKISNETNVNEEKNKMNICLNVKIFEGIENAPFYMEVKITGFFELIGNEDITKYEPNAIAILYPYIRAIVSTYTSSANIQTLILPAINVNAMLKNNKEENEEN